MKKPVYQRAIYILIWMFSGAATLGSVLGLFGYAFNMFSFRLTIVLSLIILTAFIALIILFKYRKVKWVSDTGQVLRIIRFGKKLLYNITGAFFLLWAGVLYNTYSPSSSWNNVRKPAFDSADTRFKVLILPWEKECEYGGAKYDIGRVIQKRFADLNKEGRNSIHTYYLTDSLDYRNFTHEMADSLMKFHRADQVLYGSYSFKECEGGESGKICFNYQTAYKDWCSSDAYDQVDYKMIDFKGLEDIRQGGGKEGADYIIYWVSAVAEMKRGYFSAALDRFRMIEGFEENANILFQMGYCYAALRDYKNTIAVNEKVLRLTPDNREAAVHLGIALAREGKLEAAKKNLEDVLSHCPDYLGALRNLGTVHLALKDTAAANACFEKFIKALRPDTEKRLLVLATVYKDMQNYPKAKTCLERYLQDHPGVPEVLNNVGLVCQRLKDTAGARGYFMKAIAADSSYIDARFRLGILFFQKRDYDKACVQLERVVQMNARHAEAWSYLGLVYRSFGNYAKAVQNLENALSSDSGSVNALYWSFLIHKDLKHYNKAKVCIQVLLKKTPDNVTMLNDLGGLYRDLADYKQALVCYRRVLKAIPKEGNIYYNVAGVYGDLRNKLQTLHCLSQAISLRPELKKTAQTDKAFDWIRGGKEFAALVQ
jgi:tetratricopeptide (TPR) repeat protein